MPDTKLPPSDDALERQIAVLADLAFAETDPVDTAASLKDRRGDRWNHRLALVAAVVVAALAVVGFAWIFGRSPTTVGPIGDSEQRQRTVADDGSGDGANGDLDDEVGQVDDLDPELDALPPAEITDPFDIDLDPHAAASDQNRFEMLRRPIRTLEFTDLPDGWEMRSEEVELGFHFSGEPSIVHYINVDGPGPLRAVVSIDAAWDSGVVRPEQLPAAGSANELDLGGSTAYYSVNQLTWNVDDRLVARLFVDAESSVANTEAELLELAPLLSVVERPLGSDPTPVPAGDVVEVDDPLLAGRLGGNEWAVFADGDELEVAYRPAGDDDWVTVETELYSRSQAGETAEPLSGRVVETMTADLPDGVLWFGTISEPVDSLTLRLVNGPVVLPAVRFEEGSAFAIPIDRRLDVVEAFAGAIEDGDVLFREELRMLSLPIKFADS